MELMELMESKATSAQSDCIIIIIPSNTYDNFWKKLTSQTINRSSFYARSRLSTAFLSCTYSIGFLSLLLFTNHFTSYYAHSTRSTSRLSVTLIHAPSLSWMLEGGIDGKAVGSFGNVVTLARRRPPSNGWSSRHTSIGARTHAHNVSCEHLCNAWSC